MDNDNMNAGTPENKEGQQQQNNEKTYTQAEFEAELQKETDRRVTAALKKQAQKNEAKVKEAEKLAQMNEQEKYEYQLQQREKAIAEKEKELALAENKNEASKILAEKGLSLQLVDFVVAEDADTMAANIKLLETEFNKSVKAEVEKRLASKAPRKNLPLDQTLTKEEFRKLSTVDLMRLKQENPDLYNTFMN